MNKNVTLLVALMMSGTSGAAYAQAAATQSTTGSTRILRAISISKQSDLEFGSIVRPASAGSSTVSIDATTGTRTIGAGGAVGVASTSGRATYTVTGEGGQGFSISTPATFNMTNGSESITVTPTTTSATAQLSGDIGSSGTANFGVGGSFSVSNTTVTGNYSGNFNVVVTYN